MRRRVRGVILLTTLVFCLSFVVLAWAGCSPVAPKDTPTSLLSSMIDRPAVDRVAPPDAVVNVKTAYGGSRGRAHR